jgi:hypothetical protein
MNFPQRTHSLESEGNCAFCQAGPVWARAREKSESISVKAGTLTVVQGSTERLDAMARSAGAGLEHQATKDVATGFWTCFIEPNHLGKARPEEGKFRSFLFAYLEKLMWNDLRWQRVERPGGRAVLVSKGCDGTGPSVTREKKFSRFPPARTSSHVRTQPS